MPEPTHSGEPDVDRSSPTPPDNPTPPPKPRDKDDKDLQLFEAQGKLALIELMGREMPETDRREALRALSSQFQGTSAATEALEKAEAITNRIVAEENSRLLRATEVDAMMAKLREAAKLEESPPHPGRSFLAMRAVEGQAAVRDYPEFVDQRKTLETIVCRTANAYADRVMTEAGNKLDSGDYDAALVQLNALMPVFDLPDFPMGEAPSGVTELYDKGRIARERLHTWEQTREVVERRRDSEDARFVALGFGGASGLEKELRQLDFAAAKKRIDDTLVKVGLTGPTRALLTELSADCDRARAVLETLGRECASGGWRRKSFNDPREKKGVTRNATGADATGLLFDGESGASDHVPWSAFGGNSKELSKLFYQRLTREWTSAELRGIAALLRLEGCVEVVDLSAKMFDAQRKANFTESNKNEILEIGTTLQTWAPLAPEERTEIAKEMEAAGILALALRQATETQWSTAVSQIERLLYEYQGTLIVRLLSNGNPPEEPR